MYLTTVSFTASAIAFVTDYEQWNVPVILLMLLEDGRPLEQVMVMEMVIHWMCWVGGWIRFDVCLLHTNRHADT